MYCSVVVRRLWRIRAWIVRTSTPSRASPVPKLCRVLYIGIGFRPAAVWARAIPARAGAGAPTLVGGRVVHLLCGLAQRDDEERPKALDQMHSRGSRRARVRRARHGRAGDARPRSIPTPSARATISPVPTKSPDAPRMPPCQTANSPRAILEEEPTESFVPPRGQLPGSARLPCKCDS